MRIVTENLWLHADMWVVTTNATIKKNGTLVMGRGAALEAKEKFPGIDFECGKIIKYYSGFYNWKGVYGFVKICSYFGIFQVKFNWWEKADLKLIENSSYGLGLFASENPKLSIRMNFPAIGNGQLKREQVEPYLQNLPDNITICLKED